jgi:hypothetical protein
MAVHLCGFWEQQDFNLIRVSYAGHGYSIAEVLDFIFGLDVTLVD